MGLFLAYIIVFLIGAIVALSEIVSRYRDDPWDAATSRSGIWYLLFNAGVSVGVFYLLRDVFPLQGQPVAGKELAHLWTDVFLAGAAAMAVLRTSFMTVHVDGKDIQIGLAAVIDGFRTAIDRDVDRLRAGPRAEEVATTMHQVSFERAKITLTSMALNMMQNVSADERARVEQKIAALDSQDRDDGNKALELGLILAGVIGFNNLKKAVDINRDSITTAMTRAGVVETALDHLTPAAILNELPMTCLSLSTALSSEAQEALMQQISDVMLQADVAEHVKAINVALLVAHFVGEATFRSGVKLLSKKPEESVQE